MDAQQFKGKTAAIDLFGLTADKDFAKEFVIAWFQSQGVRIAANPDQAQLHLKDFASALGVDQGQSFFGAPVFTIPLIGFVMPEIPLFKEIKHSGYAEIKVSTTDVASGNFVGESAPVTGEVQPRRLHRVDCRSLTRTDLETPNWSLVNGMIELYFASC